jgi:hypothetical protein
MLAWEAVRMKTSSSPSYRDGDARHLILMVAVVLAASLLPGAAPRGQEGIAGPLTQVSGPSPFIDCTADDPESQSGSPQHHSEVEPWVAVNPSDPLHIVASWQQDWWTNGASRGQPVGVSFDGGMSWQTVTVPGTCRCTGGDLYRIGDPWLSFGPDGTIHHISLALGPENAMLVSRSTDGGLTWSTALELIRGSHPFLYDKESITADPTDPAYVYAAWDREDRSRLRGPALFTRSVDGGLTWEPARIIHDPRPRSQTLGHQIVVHPDGTLFDFFAEIHQALGGPLYLAFKTSADRGETWWPPGVARRALGIQAVRAVTPSERITLRDAAFIFDVAMDRRNGNFYAVWQEGSFSNFLYSQVAFSMSTDGGLTWSAPLTINATPDDIFYLNRQAIIPSVHVSDNGMVGVSFYDFRFDDETSGELTDYWFTWCHPDAADCSRPGRWRNELRLTDESFDFLQAPAVGDRLFLGDYVGLTAAGDDFLPVFTMPHDDDPSSVFLRRVTIPPVVDPGSNGYWKHQVRAHLTGRGRPHQTTKELFIYLADLKHLYDVFDDVKRLDGLAAVLDPPAPADMRTRLEQHLMTLLLNLTSVRLSPFAELGEGATVKEAIDAIVAVGQDPDADGLALEAAKDLAERLNHGDLSVIPNEELMRARSRLRREPAGLRGSPVRELPGLRGSEPLSASPEMGRRLNLLQGGTLSAERLDGWGLVRVEIQALQVAPDPLGPEAVAGFDRARVMPEFVYRAGARAADPVTRDGPVARSGPW